MRVAIVGSRNCKNEVIDEIKRRIPAGTTQIISGGAGGVDRLAEEIAKSENILFRKILPDYETYGKNAPLVRNREIASSADLVLAFWDYRSRGTASVIAACIERGVPVEVYGIAD